MRSGRRSCRWLLRMHVSFAGGAGENGILTGNNGAVDNAGRGNDFFIQGNDDGADNVTLLTLSALTQEEITTACLDGVAGA
jgi:hypothetical protein